MKVFISQPMKGLSNEDIKSARDNAIAKVKEKYTEVEVIDSFFEDAPIETKPLWFLGKSIELLSTADIAVFIEGWQETRGCIIENECALKYGIDVIYL